MTAYGHCTAELHPDLMQNRQKFCNFLQKSKIESKRPIFQRNSKKCFCAFLSLLKIRWMCMVSYHVPSESPKPPWKWAFWLHRWLTPGYPIEWQAEPCGVLPPQNNLCHRLSYRKLSNWPRRLKPWNVQHKDSIEDLSNFPSHFCKSRALSQHIGQDIASSLKNRDFEILKTFKI